MRHTRAKPNRLNKVLITLTKPSWRRLMRPFAVKIQQQVSQHLLLERVKQIIMSCVKEKYRWLTFSYRSKESRHAQRRNVTT